MGNKPVNMSMLLTTLHQNSKMQILQQCETINFTQCEMTALTGVTTLSWRGSLRVSVTLRAMSAGVLHSW